MLLCPLALAGSRSSSLLFAFPLKSHQLFRLVRNDVPSAGGTLVILRGAGCAVSTSVGRKYTDRGPRPTIATDREIPVLNKPRYDMLCRYPYFFHQWLDH